MRSIPWFVALMMLGACDRSSDAPLRIVLDRGSCFLACASYRVAIRHDGRVSYEGTGVPFALVGETEPPRVRRDSARIDRTKAASVFAAFDRAWSRWRPNRVRFGDRACGDGAHDFGTMFVVRESATRRDTMEVYLGCPHAPDRILQLGAYIDSLAGVEWWLLANPAAFRALCSQADSGLTVAAHRCTPRESGRSRR